MEYRPCPSLEGYSATLCGAVRRDARKSGKPLKVWRDQSGRAIVTIMRSDRPHSVVTIARVVRDAWGEAAPEPEGYIKQEKGRATPADTRAAYTGLSLATEYRAIPSAPAYEVSISGRVRKIETLRAASLINSKGCRDRVMVAGVRRYVHLLINEAWPELSVKVIPTRRKRLPGDDSFSELPTYPDGRILTVEEYRAQLDQIRKAA
jgi:hypothetical protein